MEIIKEAPIKPMNIYAKLQKCRVGLNESNLKMTGKVDYVGQGGRTNFEYFELGDFLPTVNKLCDRYSLATIFHYTNEEASLTIIDTDDPEKTIIFTTPIEIAAIKGCGTMQNIGGTQTFARRYLYIMAFEVSEPDTVNQGEKDEEEQEAMKKIDPVKLGVIKNLIKESGSNEAAFLKYFKLKNVESITNKMFPQCLRALEAEKKKHQEQSKQPSIEDIQI